MSQTTRITAHCDDRTKARFNALLEITKRSESAEAGLAVAAHLDLHATQIDKHLREKATGGKSR